MHVQMRLNPRLVRAAARAALTFAPTLVALLVGLVLYDAAGAWRETDRLRERTHAAAVALMNVLSTVEEAESGQRGYLLTGSREYLAPYEAARARIGRDTAELARRVRGVGGSAAQLDSLRAEIAAKFAELDETVRLDDESRPDSAAAIVRTGRGRRLMERIQALGQRIRDASAERVRAREAELERGEAAATLAVAVGTLVTALTALLVNLVIARGTERIRQSAAEIDAQNRRLGAQAAELTLVSTELRASNARLAAGADALVRSEARFRALIENSSELILVTGRDGVVRFAAGAVERELGYATPALEGQAVFDFVAPHQVAAAREAVERAAANPGESVALEVEVATAAGATRVLDVVARDLSHVAAVGGVVLNARDVTARRRAEAELRHTAEELAATVHASPLPIVVLDRGERVTTWSAAAERVFGWTADEVLGGPVPLLDASTRPEGEALFERERGGELLTDVEMRRRRKDGEWLDLSLSTAPIRSAAGEVIGTVGIFADVTERRRTQDALRDAEAQLMQAQKMEAVGRLAGGVAHDFNNLLTVIGGNVQLLLFDAAPGSPAHEDLEETSRAVVRAAALTRQLLAFSRRQVMQPRTVDVVELAAGLGRLLDRVIGEDVELRFELPPELWPVRADPGQLEQVLVNLAVNARDAMPLGGVLRVAARNLHPGELAPGAPAGLEGGEHVLLEVSDTGVGMDEQLLARVFEPFYTTKPEGKGTGLGLATVYGIVAQSGGAVWLTSAPGRGTTAHVCLPRDVAAEGPARAVEPEPASPGRGGTVLVVEDENDVRAMVARILGRAGMRVVEARSASEALEAVAKHGGDLDLLLTDVVMPGVSGVALAGEVRAGLPRLPVLYMSGYTDDNLLHHGVLDDDVELLEKPFSADALVGRVREVMDTRARTEAD